MRHIGDKFTLVFFERIQLVCHIVHGISDDADLVIGVDVDAWLKISLGIALGNFGNSAKRSVVGIGEDEQYEQCT